MIGALVGHVDDERARRRTEWYAGILWMILILYPDGRS
jgi:hypothetical protein